MASVGCQKSWGIGNILKATRRQRVGDSRDYRNGKHTTEILNCDGSDLISEIGNLKFGTEICQVGFRQSEYEFESCLRQCSNLLKTVGRELYARSAW